MNAARSFQTLAVVSELTGNIKTTAWSGQLVAVGLSSGRVNLCRLEPIISREESSTIVIGPRNSSRSVQSLAFGDDQILAVGLDKGRGESLIVYDVETSSRSLGKGVKPTYLPRNGSPASASSAQDRPLFEAGSNESVTATAFISGSPILIAALSKKLKAFDLRSPSNSPMSISTNRSITSIAVNPWNNNQFATQSEGDDIVRLFDLRSPLEPILSFSASLHAGSISPAMRSTAPLAQIAWSPTRRGILATMKRDADSLRIWTLSDGMPTSYGGFSRDETVERLRLPCVMSDQRSRLFQISPLVITDNAFGTASRFNQPITSFAFANSPRTHAIEFLGVSFAAGSSHSLEIVPFNSSSRVASAFTERGIALASTTSSSVLKSYDIPTNLAEDAEEDVAPPNLLLAATKSYGRDRGRALSIDSNYSRTANRTGVSGSVTPRKLSRERIAEASRGVGIEGLRSLQYDPQSTMKKRAEAGYGSNVGPSIRPSLSVLSRCFEMG
jgi:hypothetical protein